MNSKERVLRAINHQPVDRVPVDLGGAACCMVDEAYFKVKEALGIEGNIEPYRKGSNVCYYDERVLERLGVDVRRVFARQTDNYPKYHEDGTFSNEWGLIQKQGELFVETVRNPLAEAEAADLETYDWPKAEEVLDVT